MAGYTWRRAGIMCYRSYQPIFEPLEFTRLHAYEHATWGVQNSIKSEDEITHPIEELPPGEKYPFLKNHMKPDSLYVFPTTHLANFKRIFNRRWLDAYAWMVYSELLGGAFCITCYSSVKTVKIGVRL